MTNPPPPAAPDREGEYLAKQLRSLAALTSMQFGGRDIVLLRAADELDRLALRSAPTADTERDKMADTERMVGKLMLAEYPDEVPPHDCNFNRPDEGYCAFHDVYVEALGVLANAARREEGGE